MASPCALPWCVTSPFDNLYTFSSDVCYCNGHGDSAACQAVGFCVCNDGWSGRADFSNVMYSCHIYQPALTALWSLVIAGVVTTYLVCGWKVANLIQRFLATRRKMHSKNKPYSLHNNRGLGVLLILFTVTLPAILGTAIARLADANQRIALSWVMSVAWFLALSSYYLATHKYNTALATSALKAEQASGKLVARYRNIGRAFCFVLTCSLSLAVPVFVDGGVTQSLSRGCMVGYLVWVAVVLFGFSFFLRAVRNHIIKVLSVAEENASLLHRMTRVYDTCIFAVLAQAGAFALLAVVPVLWTAHDYVLPLTFVLIPYVTWRFVLSIYLPQDDAKKRGAASQQQTSMAAKSKRLADEAEGGSVSQQY